MKKILKMTQIRTDGGTQSRKKIDTERVKDYAERMKEGHVYDPVDVFYDGKDYWLADGFHRMSARKSNGEKEIEVVVHEGTKRDAFIFAVGANNDGRGLSMTFQENRDNIVVMLKDEEWSKWSDERIASVVRVTRLTVFRIRKKLEQEGELQPKKSTKYVDKHGKETEMVVKQAEKTAPPPQTVSEDLDSAEMADTVTQLAEENEVLKEQIALGQFDGNEFEKLDIQEMLKDLREKNRLLELENKTLRESRDAYQYENAQLIKTVKSLKAQLKKTGIE